ncbi:hypothetical protein SteCoe_16305 [Stentor coeruleus]|uniref:t-SNARE coiled-coil homology domain-containing protein n=1 Tax=Stentor coeruleus TaxID=5963 RepID=A0A1R2C1P4_9CILI|nr:hypothetical protein SteCoe_16305 [Stentor coeruleus]
MQKNFEVLIALVKDLQTAFKAFRTAVKKHLEPEELDQKQVAFLKILKSFSLLITNTKDCPEVKNLKRETEQIVKEYKELCKEKDNIEMPTEILIHSFEEDKDVYNNPEDINNRISLERNKEIVKLHKEMSEINEIFKDFSMLVIEQGVELEKARIEVDIAERTTERVNNELVKARYWDKKSRNKCCCISIIVGGFVMAIGGVVAGVVISGK